MNELQNIAQQRAERAGIPPSVARQIAARLQLIPRTTVQQLADAAFNDLVTGRA